MKKLFLLGLLCLLGLVLTTNAVAETATKGEVVLKCKEAVQYYKANGADNALAKVNDKTGQFVWKDSYVFAVDLKHGKVVAHPIKPALVGKTLVGLKDINGKMFFNEFIHVGKTKGEGWVSYMWPKPGEKKPSPKLTYVHRIEGEDVAMLSGIYE
jgi:cytochrome c